RPYFMGATLLFLAGAWCFTLRRHPARGSASPSATGAAGGFRGAPESCCAPNSARHRNIVLLSGVTAFALAMLAFPQISTVLAGSRGAELPVPRSAGPVEST